MGNAISLTVAEGGLLEQILDETYPVWGEGLSRAAYGQWNRAQMTTSWGRDHLRRVALLEGAEGVEGTKSDTLLASAKRYDFEARVGGRVSPVIGIGAVFTAAPRRGRGHARVLVEMMVADARARGCRYALLFSEIGAAYYGALGFHVVPRTQFTIDIARKPGAPAIFIRTGLTDDLPFIAELSSAYATDAAFALERPPALIEFGIARRRLLAGLGPAGLRQVEFFVAEEGHRPAAYVVISRGPDGAVLEECGDRDPSGARVGAMLQVLAARTPAEHTTPMRAWLPDTMRPPQVCIIEQSPPAEVMMLQLLDDVPSSKDIPASAVYWPTDVF